VGVKPASSRVQGIAKSLAAEIAREMSVTDSEDDNPYDQRNQQPAKPENDAIDASNPATIVSSDETQESSPAAIEAKSDTVKVANADAAGDSDAADAFAQGLIEAASVGDRYATSQPLPSQPASSRPAGSQPLPAAALQANLSEGNDAVVTIPADSIIAAGSDAGQRINTPKIEEIAENDTPSSKRATSETSGPMSLIIGSDEKPAPVVKLDSAGESTAFGSGNISSQFDDARQQPGIAPQIGSATTDPESELLMSGQMPLIASRVNGPRRITVGRKVNYTVLLANRGDAAAEQLVARVRVPEWADVVATKSGTGSVQRSASSAVEADQGSLLEWRIDRFAAQGSAKLELTLIARQGRPIELGVDWSHAPVGSRTVVEVQEPKLEMNVTGPDEIQFGKPLRYRLTLSNPGTGTAEDVTIFLQPPGKPASEASKHRFGSLAAGQTKTVEIELTAREAGELSLLARATGAGGVEAATEKKLFCRKPALEVDWRGPSHKYTGALATYYFRVRNPGTAPAEDVTFVVDLPTGFQVQATSAGQTYDAGNRRLTWKVGALRPGDDKYLQVRGVPSAAGDNQFQIAAATPDRIASDTATAMTEVVAVADLKLEVRDPKGPLPVGAETVYEVRVKNRGSSAASQVNIVAMFSEGIEPYMVEGGEFSVADGRVSLGTLASLPAGGEKVFKIRARAESPGTHVFRAEVLCRELDTKLTAQEMTKFYAEESIDLGDAPQATQKVDRFVYPR